jgi:Lysylphosphatidylglycerol synthase TM region
MISRLVFAGLAVVVTAAALWLFVTPQTTAALTGVFANGKQWPLGVAFALSAGIQWLRAWRFAIMTRGDLALPDAQLVRIAFQLNFFNFILPFRLGELSYPVQMHRIYGQPLLNAAGVLILARLFDLATVSAIMLAAAAVLGLAGSSAGMAAFWVAASALAITPGALVLLGRAARPFIMRLPWLAGIAEPLGAGIDALSTRRARFAVIGLSFAVWLTFGALAILTADAVVDSVTPAVALLGASAGNLAFALPINGIAGLGPSQAAWVGAVSQAGVPWEDAVVSALTLYSISLASALLFGGVAMLRGRCASFPLGASTAA